MIYAGVDIAKMDHVVDAVDESGNQVAKAMPFKNSEAGFEKCVAWLEGVAEDPTDVAVAMEATGHYWMACFTYLAARGYSVVVVNPVHVRAVRKIKNLSGVKNDRIDAWLIAETLRIGEYDPTRLATDELQSLKTLTRYRQSIRDSIAEAKTKATCLMDSYFPEYAGLFSDMFGAASMAVLARACVPSEVSKARASTLAKLMSDASRGRLGAEKAAELKAAAKSSVGIRLGEDAAAFEIREYVDLIGLLEAKAARADAQIAELLDRIEPLILTIPGVSVTLGAQIVAEIGDVRRFRNVASIVKYAGLNSGVSQSGRFEAEGEPITKAGSPYLRRAMWLAADCARRFDPKLREFYEKKRAEGKCHRVAVTAVARKLCHVVYAVMRDQVPYDPDR
ncbi:MAG: IS110 family transposase [Eggerthellaceae bacterium]|nr:IS110 family transposase [Eggerthellaceae bacterium]